MDKYYGDGYGNQVVAGERAEYINQLPTSGFGTSATTASGGEEEEEEMKASVDTSGFGMYSSGTGTGAINGGGGLFPDQYATSFTAIQTQLPCYSSSEEDEMGRGSRKKKGKKEKKGLMERIKEKLPGHHHH